MGFTCRAPSAALTLDNAGDKMKTVRLKTAETRLYSWWCKHCAKTNINRSTIQWIPLHAPPKRAQRPFWMILCHPAYNKWCNRHTECCSFLKNVARIGLWDTTCQEVICQVDLPLTPSGRLLSDFHRSS